jgi:hypothetical protein
MENKNSKVLVKSKKCLVKKRQLTNLEKAQQELDEVYSELFEKYIDIDINRKFHFINGQKETFYNLYEHHKRDLENKYELEPCTLTKSIFDNEDILDAPSNVVNFLSEPIDISHEADMIEVAVNTTRHVEINKLKKKIQRAEATIAKDKKKLIQLANANENIDEKEVISDLLMKNIIGKNSIK